MIHWPRSARTRLSAFLMIGLKMNNKLLLSVCLATATVIKAAQSPPAVWKLQLDLRNQAPEAAAAAAIKLSSRLYGKTESALHHPLVFETDFPTAKVFAFELASVSLGGSDLV